MIYSRETEKKITFLKGMAVMLVVTIGVVCYYQFYRLKITTKNAEINYVATQTEVKGKEIDVYVPVEPIKQGEPLGKVKVLKQFASLVPEDSIKNRNEIEHMVAKYDISLNTPLAKSMFVSIDDKITADLRKVEITNVKLMGGLGKDMYVDIRFKNKLGEDSIVLAKKKVIDTIDSKLYVLLSEKEINYYNNATVEAAGLVGGASGEMYTTIYPDPQNQPAATVTYKIKPNIQALIESNPNVIKESQQKTETKSDTTSTDTSNDSTKGTDNKTN